MVRIQPQLHFAGFKSRITVKSNERGEVDIDDLKRVVNENTATIMLTNPNTLGIFEKILWKSVKSSIMLVVYYIMMVRILNANMDKVPWEI